MSTLTTLPFYPLNDFACTVTLKDVNLLTGKVTNLTTGTVTAFIATTHTATAAAADVTLSMTPTHIGSGKWLVAFDATLMDATLLDGLFAATPTAAYLIVEHDGGVRAYVPLTYTPSRLATITTTA